MKKVIKIMVLVLTVFVGMAFTSSSSYSSGIQIGVGTWYGADVKYNGELVEYAEIVVSPSGGVESFGFDRGRFTINFKNSGRYHVTISGLIGPDDWADKRLIFDVIEDDGGGGVTIGGDIHL